MPRAQKTKTTRPSTLTRPKRNRVRPRKHQDEQMQMSGTVTSPDLTLTQYSPPPSTAFCLRLAMDIGTTSTTVAYQVCAAKDDLPPIHVARLHEMEYECPMIVRYNEAGQFEEGPGLINQLDDGLLGEDDCLRFSKLALQPNTETKAIYEKVIAHTSRVGKKPEDIFVDYLAAIVRKAKAYIKGTSYGNVDNTPLELFISTPQIWAPATNLAMIEAGKRMASKCAIVPEPLCAAAFVLNDEINVGSQSNTNVTLGVDDLVLVADLGGGTADLVLFRLCSAPANGPNFTLEVVRPANGSLAGATQINRNYLKWVKEKKFHGNMEVFEHTANELGFEASEFAAKLSAVFETCKLEFPKSNNYNVVVNCRQGAQRPSWICTLSRGDMESLFRPVVDDVVKLIRDTLVGIEDPDEPEKLRSFILCGGSRNSSHVRKVLQTTFSAINILCPKDEYKAPVAKGALLRYTVPSLQKPLGYGWSLCCIRNEFYDPSLHKDATTRKNEPNRRIAKADPRDAEAWEVEDRCAYILDGVKNITKQKWSIHHPPITELPIVITAEVYFTIKPDISEHEPLCVKGTTTLRDCFSKFCDVKKTISDPAAANIKQIQQKDGTMTWEIFSCVVIKRSADSVKLGIHIGDKTDVYDENGTFDEDREIPEHEWADMQEIWSAQFSRLSMELLSFTPACPSTAAAVQVAEDNVEEQIVVKAEPDSESDGLSDLYEFVE